MISPACISVNVVNIVSMLDPLPVAQGLSCNATFPLPPSELDSTEAPYLSHQL